MATAHDQIPSLKLIDDHVLLVSWVDEAGVLKSVPKDLDDLLGNVGGAFDIEAVFFSRTARNIKLVGNVLSASLWLGGTDEKFDEITLLWDEFPGSQHLNATQHHGKVLRMPSLALLELHDAITSGQNLEKILKSNPKIIHSRNRDGETPLHFAVFKNRLPAVELLLKHGADVNAANRTGVVPLHYATYYGLNEDHEILELLLKQEGVLVDARSAAGGSTNSSTALQIAVSFKKARHVKLLLEHGADITIPSEQLKEPDTLHHIVSARYDADSKIWTMIIDTIGVDVNCRRDGQRTPLHRAVLERNPDAIRALLRHNADVNAKDINGQTPLHYTIIESEKNSGLTEILDILLSARSVLVDERDNESRTPLHEACARGWTYAVRCLLEEGADANARETGFKGSTPLHRAVSNNHLGAVRALLAAGADPNIRDRKTQTPVDLAYLRRYITVAEVLECHQNVEDEPEQPMTKAPSLQIAAPTGNLEDLCRSVKCVAWVPFSKSRELSVWDLVYSKNPEARSLWLSKSWNKVVWIHLPANNVRTMAISVCSFFMFTDQTILFA